MNFAANKTALAAAIALTASVGLTLPAAAEPTTHGWSHHHQHHAWVRSHAYRLGYREGFRDGHVAAVEGPIATGRSAYVEPAPVVAANDGIFGNGGLLGLGILGGNGVLGTGVLNGQGALGVGVLGF